MTDKHVILDFSQKARVFVAGDIHGELSMLMEQLAKHQFDESHDVLVLVGDMCDRGPDSEGMLDLIDKPWVYRVLGNHDIAPRLYLTGQFGRQAIEERFGWSLGLLNSPTEQIKQISVKLEDAPVRSHDQDTRWADRRVSCMLIVVETGISTLPHSIKHGCMISRFGQEKPTTG